MRILKEAPNSIYDWCVRSSTTTLHFLFIYDEVNRDYNQMYKLTLSIASCGYSLISCFLFINLYIAFSLFVFVINVW